MNSSDISLSVWAAQRYHLDDIIPVYISDAFETCLHYFSELPASPCCPVYVFIIIYLLLVPLTVFAVLHYGQSDIRFGRDGLPFISFLKVIIWSLSRKSLLWGIQLVFLELAHAERDISVFAVQ